MVSQLERTLRVNQLFDLYGGLLTERQHRVVYLYYSMDLSLGEIAQRTGVTRQAIHDSLVRALATLEAAEGRIGLLGRLERLQRLIGELERSLEHPEADGREFRRILAEIKNANPLR